MVVAETNNNDGEQASDPTWIFVGSFFRVSRIKELETLSLSNSMITVSPV